MASGQGAPSRARVRGSLAGKIDELQGLSSVASTKRVSVRAAAASAALSAGHGSDSVVVFMWKGEKKAREVFLAGSFNQWKDEIPMVQTRSGLQTVFAAVLELSAGMYTYRFKVDGEWRVSEDDEDIVEDTDGLDSHYLAVGVSEQEVYEQEQAIFRNAVIDAIQVHAEQNRNGAQDMHRYKQQKEQEVKDMERTVATSRHAAVAQTSAAAMAPKKGLVSKVLDNLLFVGARPTPAAAASHKSGVTASGRAADSEDDVYWSGSDDGDQYDDSDDHAAENVAPLQVFFPNAEDGKVDPSTIKPQTGAPPTAAGATVAGTGPYEKSSMDIPYSKSGTALVTKTPAKQFLVAESNAMDRQAVAGAMFKQGNYEAALAMYSVAIRIRETNGLRMTPNNALCHMELGATLIHLEDYSTAEKHLKIARSMWSNGGVRFGNGNMEQYADIVSFLACALDRQKKRSEAEYYYRKALHAYEKVPASKREERCVNHELTKTNLEQNVKKQIRDGQEPGTFEPKKNRVERTSDIVEAVTRHADRERAQPSSASASAVAALGKTKPQAGSGTGALTRMNSSGSAAQVPNMQIQSDEMGMSGRSNLMKSERSFGPNNWKELATAARASMPRSPPALEPEEVRASRALDTKHVAESRRFDQMAQEWHRDANTMAQKKAFDEANDLYTLAVYARKKKAEFWYTQESAALLLDYANCLVGMQRYADAERTVVMAIAVVEKTKLEPVKYGMVWLTMARISGAKRDCEKAQKQYMKAIEVYKKEQYKGPELAQALSGYISVKKMIEQDASAANASNSAGSPAALTSR
ncbi:5'-AMP-activated protein kinase subunit beta-2 [Porphyridium purpureum]|uniref:5'-AMP-activated protein kinase subunit beta-2 n=1 Tax=Porphyridium purpureum TaxID=35688 RepID=A0A5J4YTD1_PORPP|nr:5'-AMP-activated protein kinase subunit beta-2 [Porphyridium purpureum]|eukprot:POR0805..scf227_4